MRRIVPALALALCVLVNSATAAPSPGTWQIFAPQRTAPVFYHPSSIADGVGSAWVADSAYGTVTRLSLDGVALPGWGTPHQFQQPSGVAVAPTRHEVYVAERGTQRVKVVSLGGASVATSEPLGPPDQSWNSDIVIAAGPNGNAVAVRGDRPFLRVAHIGPHGQALSRWSVHLHHNIDLSYQGPLGPNPLSFDGLHPLGVAVGRSGEIDVYFQALASGGGRDEISRSWTFIQRISYRGTFISEIPVAYDPLGHILVPTGIAMTASGVLLAPDPSSFRLLRLPSSNKGHWLQTTSACGDFSPAGIAVDGAGRLLVANWQDAVVEVLSLSGRQQGLWGACPSSLFKYPYGVAVDRNGNAYVADPFSEKVVKFGSDGRVLLSWSVSGSPAAAPSSIALAPDGTVYVVNAANATVDLYTPTGVRLARWGGHGSTPGLFDAPASIAVDRTGDVYVSDSNNNRIQIFSPSGAVLAIWGGPTQRGLGVEQLNTPVGLAVGPDGAVYIADAGNGRIVVRSPGGEVLRTIAVPAMLTGALSYPQYLAVAPDGSVYVTDATDHLVRLSASGALVGVWGGTGVAPGEFQGPRALALDARGDLYVVDSRNHRVQTLRL